MTRCPASGSENVEVAEPSWFAVRNIIKNGEHFEERITIWQCSSFDDAIERGMQATADYLQYLWKGAEALEWAEAFRLAEPPGHGEEVFSLIRASELSADDYVKRFFETGTELRA